uniref:Uncharacterized protein n=1 Tax=Anguilla anguilla TaxID=7936 RepID=A0A0E9TB93_ANGAN
MVRELVLRESGLHWSCFSSRAVHRTSTHYSLMVPSLCFWASVSVCGPPGFGGY